MEPKTFGVGAAGLVIGLAIARVLPSALPGSPATAPDPAPAASAMATPFACARAGGTPADEIASHKGRVTVFVKWEPRWASAWLPMLERLRATYAGRGVDVVGLPAVEKLADVEALCRENRLRWQQLFVTFDEAWTEVFSNYYVVILDRSGDVTHRGYFDQGIALGIEDALQEAPRSVNGRVLHRGRTIANFTDLDPKITIKNALNWNAQPVSVEYFRATGSFTAKVVPGTYFASVDVGRDWFGATHVGVPDYPTDKPIEIEVLRRVHLTSPIDSDVPQGANEDPPPFHTSPVTIAWKAVPGANRYNWNMSNREKSVSESTSATSATATLPPGEYTLYVTAYENDRVIGNVRVQYSGWPMDGYEFRVPPK